MTVAELIAKLQMIPPDLPVMLDAEGGIDHACSIRLIEAVRDDCDWGGTPVGQYRELSDEEDTASTCFMPFRAVLIDLDARADVHTPAACVGVLPVWACIECGAKISGPVGSDVTWHHGQCGICGCNKQVTEFQNYT